MHHMKGRRLYSDGVRQDDLAKGRPGIVEATQKQRGSDEASTLTGKRREGLRGIFLLTDPGRFIGEQP
jgi:hypothetical protein